MRASTKNPAPLAAGRAPNSFCLAAEQSEDSKIPAVNQASILGIDIGSKGAIALLTPNGELLDAVEMPCLNDGPAGRRNVNGPLLAEIIAKAHASSAYVELVGARPGEGAVGAFAFGRSRASSRAFYPHLASGSRTYRRRHGRELLGYRWAVKGRRTPRAPKPSADGQTRRPCSPANATMAKPKLL